MAGNKDSGRHGDAVEKLLMRIESFDGNNFQEETFRAETNMNAVLLDGAQNLMLSENAIGEITERNLVEDNKK